MIRRASIFSTVALAIAAIAAGCGQENALVGGECADGYTQCDLKCLDLSSDPLNCGACGHACDPGVACIRGACATGPYGTDASTDGPSDGGAQDDATVTPDAADAGDGSTTDGSSDGADAGTADASDADAADVPDVSPDGAACTPPYDTIYQCGDCQTSCSLPDDACLAGGDAGYHCGQLCALPLKNCGGACVDETSDPFNCGACGKVCASHLCVNSICQGSTPGDVVLIGHDYATTTTTTAQAIVLQNAAFIPTTNPLRVFTYERYADAVAVANAKSVLAARATQQHRTINTTIAASDADVTSLLAPAAFDVFVMFDQKNAAAGTMANLGSAWASTLTAFNKGGGVVVVLDGDVGTAEMPDFVANGGLLDVTGHAPVSAGSPVVVTGSGDSIAVGVLSPYGVWDHSASFALGSFGNVTQVVRTAGGTGDPVVLHRVVP